MITSRHWAILYEGTLYLYSDHKADKPEVTCTHITQLHLFLQLFAAFAYNSFSLYYCNIIFHETQRGNYYFY